MKLRPSGKVTLVLTLAATALVLALLLLTGAGSNDELSQTVSLASRNPRDLLRPSIPGRDNVDPDLQPAAPPAPGGKSISGPFYYEMHGKSKVFDVRALPQTPPVKQERQEREGPAVNPSIFGTGNSAPPAPAAPVGPLAAAPTPIASFDGLDYATWGGGHPPDTNGDVGPTYYIQTVNTSIGIYNKSTGVRTAAFSFNTFMSQGAFGNLCDANNYGDPVALYDTFNDRWVITDFAFVVSGGNVVAPAYQCFAVSKTGDPVSGGWNFYSLLISDALNDYPKLGIWPDGLYMSANMFSFGAGSAFQGARVWAFNLAQMEAGSPTVQNVAFNAPSSEFTLLPANARLQTGAPPVGTPNYFAVVWQYLNSFSVYKFHVDWNNISTSTFTGPFQSTMTYWWAQLSGSTAPSPSNALDTLYPRMMVQNQYTNIGGVESLWDAHTVGAGNPTTSSTVAQAAIRYYQVKVTGGTVEANTTQSYTYSPDASLYRFMPSVAVDRTGNMAIGYSTSNATTNPAIKYAGRLSGDAVNTIGQTEQLLLQGGGTQSGTCGTTCTRWGDYSAFSLDPDGCTFWYTTEYYATTGLNDLTRIGSFKYPSCTPVGSGGTVQGTVTKASNGAAISGATVTFGARTTTTNGSGFYQFTSIPAGAYTSVAASATGYNSASASPISVTDSGTTTQNLSLSNGGTGGCLTDTTQADFQKGVATNCDLTGNPNNVTLLDAPTIDQ
ncbi:MAG: carboxypeptidase-like regulatory domain-containing protein, partial [Anaerolineae bacterium]